MEATHTNDGDLSELQWQLYCANTRYEALKESSKTEASKYRKTIAQRRADCDSRDRTIETLRSEISRLRSEISRLQAEGAVADENVDPN